MCRYCRELSRKTRASTRRQQVQGTLRGESPRQSRKRPRPRRQWFSMRASNRARTSPTALPMFSPTLQSGSPVLPDNSIHAIVTDPPYGSSKYNETNHAKMRKRQGRCLAHSADARRRDAESAAALHCPIGRRTGRASRNFFAKMAKGVPAHTRTRWPPLHCFQSAVVVADVRRVPANRS